MNSLLRKASGLLLLKGKSHLRDNVEYRLTDWNGKPIPLFKDYFLNRAILSIVRGLYSFREADGSLKTGTALERLLTNLALYGVRIPHVTGIWMNRILVPNGVTSAGLAAVASRINGSGGEAAFTYIALGEGTTAFAAGQTALVSETTGSGLGRALATLSRVTTDVANDTAQLLVNFTALGPKAITESGVFNDATTGVMLCRQVFSAINLAATDVLQVTWKIDVDG